jgi:hypothetical protein
MDATILEVDKAIALDALRAYRNARAAVTDEDRAIMTAYKQIARGRVVVQAIESIRQAGRQDDGLPHLAITNAAAQRVHCWAANELVEFSEASKRGGASTRSTIRVDRMLPPRAATGKWNATALVPLIPLHLRPKFDLRRYWILWEADWVRAPVDPYLLRRLKGDLWIVLAAWELTAVERAVLEQRTPQ